MVAPVTVNPSPLIMDPMAAGSLQNPVVRPLLVVSSSPFQSLASNRPIPASAVFFPWGGEPGGHSPPLADRFPWRRYPGQGHYADSHPHDRFHRTDRGRSEYQPDRAVRQRKEYGRSRAGAGKTRRKAGRSGVRAARHRLPNRDLPPNGNSSDETLFLANRRTALGRFRIRALRLGG